jgi:hypothetical protein
VLYEERIIRAQLPTTMKIKKARKSQHQSQFVLLPNTQLSNSLALTHWNNSLELNLEGRGASKERSQKTLRLP